MDDFYELYRDEDDPGPVPDPVWDEIPTDPDPLVIDDPPVIVEPDGGPAAEPPPLDQPGETWAPPDVPDELVAAAPVTLDEPATTYTTIGGDQLDGQVTIVEPDGTVLDPAATPAVAYTTIGGLGLDDGVSITEPDGTTHDLSGNPVVLDPNTTYSTVGGPGSIDPESISASGTVGNAIFEIAQMEQDRYEADRAVLEQQLAAGDPLAFGALLSLDQAHADAVDALLRPEDQ